MQKPLYEYFYVKSPISKIAWGIASVLIGALFLLIIMDTESSRMEAQTNNWTGREIEKGAALFANNCATCHNADGSGGSGPALNSRYFFEQRIKDMDWTGSQKNYVKLTIAAGRPNLANGAHYQWPVVMPTWGNTFGGPLRSDQIDALTAYVLNWKEEATQQTPAEDPWKFFQNTLSKSLPYDESEPGYQEKLDMALAAAKAAGLSEYELNGVTYEFETDVNTDAERPPQEIWADLCSGCHKIDQDQTADNVGVPGPNQNNLYERAGNRVEGQNAEEYVRNSILNPGDYIVEGYVAGLMPATLGDQMTEAELDSLVKWLLDPNREQ